MTQYVNQFEQGKIKGMLDMQMNLNTIQCYLSGSAVAGGAVTIEDYARGIPVVKAADDTDLVFGFINYGLKKAPADGEIVEVSLPGNVMYMDAGAAFAPGTELMHVASTGKMITATGTTKCISAYAIDKATASGDIVRAMIGAFGTKRPSA